MYANTPRTAHRTASHTQHICVRLELMADYVVASRPGPAGMANILLASLRLQRDPSVCGCCSEIIWTQHVLRVHSTYECECVSLCRRRSQTETQPPPPPTLASLNSIPEWRSVAQCLQFPNGNGKKQHKLLAGKARKNTFVFHRVFLLLIAGCDCNGGDGAWVFNCVDRCGNYVSTVCVFVCLGGSHLAFALLVNTASSVRL